MMNRFACLNPFLKYPGWDDYRRVTWNPYVPALSSKQRRQILGPLLGYKWWMFPKFVRRVLSRPCSETLTEQFVTAELDKGGAFFPKLSKGGWYLGERPLPSPDFCHDLVEKDNLRFTRQEAIDWLRGVI